MDLEAVKQKLESLSHKPKSGGDVDWKAIFFKPTIGKQTIRVVPSELNEDLPFSEMLFYYGIGKKSMASPSNWGEKDPIMEFVKKLRQSDEKENWTLANSLKPKPRTFVPVIVRGEEDKGVRLWQFGKNTYQDFLNLAIDEEVGDYTDILNGRDIKLTTVGKEVTGTDYSKTTINVSLSQSPLSEDKDQLELWLKNQPNPKTIYTKFSYDEVKDALQKFLEPEEAEEVEVLEEVDNNSLNFPTNEKESDKFDSLFDGE